MYSSLHRACFTAMTTTLFVTAAYAAEVEKLPSLTVVGEVDKAAISTKTEALPGSVYIIDAQQIETAPVNNYLDLFRKQPGMNTQPYTQGGIADGIAMRGFSSGSHSNQVAVYVDGVPMNMPNHNQAHGYGDFAWITPEMIERIEIIKGPVSALYGNFALGGAINIITKSRNAGTSAGVELGSYGAKRVVGTYSSASGEISPFLVYELRDNDGYRDNSDDERYNLFNKFTFPSMGGDVSVTAHFLKEDWNAPGYISLDDVKAGLIKRTDAVIPTGSTKPSDGGDSEAMNLALRYSPTAGDAGFQGTVYFSSKELNRYSSFNSPQSWNHNERDYFGWNALYNLVSEGDFLLTVGSDGRHDDTDFQGFPTLDRVKTGGATEDWNIKELSVGLFAQAEYQVQEQVKLHGGLRYDTYHTDVDNKINPDNSGTGKTDLMSPKVGVTWSPSNTVVVYANRARGFRSPEVSEISPNTGDPNFDLSMPTVDSTDVGFNVLINPQTSFDLNYYWSTTKDEIRVIADQAVNVGETDRNGFDAQFTYDPMDNLSLFVTYSMVDAKISDPDTPGADQLSGLPENYMTIGGTWFRPLEGNSRVVVDIYGQHLGDTPLDSSGSTNRDPFWRYMGKVSYDVNQWSTFGSFTWQPDEDTAEPMFNFGGVFYAPIPKFSVNVGVKYAFD